MTGPLITIDDALRRVLDAVPGPLGRETVELEHALDRVLAADVRAAVDLPSFASSAMDGYAVAAGGRPQRLRLVGESRAGQPYTGRLRPGEAIRISTGAVVPDEAVAVVRQEDTSGDPGHVEVHVDVRTGTNIRRAGEDLRAGQRMLGAGVRLGPAEIAAAVAAGASLVDVATEPRVTILSTGDELRPPGAPLAAGQIHNSNAPMLAALAARAGAGAETPGSLGDDARSTETALAAALESGDVVIVSGGVSVGPHDHVKPALARLGVEARFWGVALQPGKPTWFGTRGRQLVFALPGNPVSAAVTFALFARPALDALLGANRQRPPVETAALGAAVRRNPGRDQAVRVRLRSDGARVLADPTGAQGSHLFTSLLGADALAIIPRGEGSCEAGTVVRLEAAPG